MADLDPKTATLREVAEAYAEKSKRQDLLLLLSVFKNIADEPGSALRLFEKDAEGNTFFKKHLRVRKCPIKTAMQNLRQVGLLKGKWSHTPIQVLPDKVRTPLNNRIFGRVNHKAVSNFNKS